MVNNFAKLIELIKTAQGNRSLNQFALHSGISAGHLSRIINGKFQTPPTPNLLKKIAEHAYNNITFDQLMKASGYYTESDNNKLSIREDSSTNYNISFTEKEIRLINKLQSTPELEPLIDELANAPTDKVKLLIKIWEAIRED